jgi:hypothetical protein
MKKLIYGTLFLALVGIGLVGCKKDTFQPTQSTSSAKVEDEEQTKIGKKLTNPFTIENMRNAYASLSKQKSSSTLESNKLYVRFLPMNSDELDVLYSDSLILSDIPLDVEVNQYGTFYNDPATLSNGTTWLYTTVDLGYDFGNIQYEIIDSLYLPNEGGDGQKSMNLFSEFSKDQLEAKALELAGYKDEATASLEKATKYRPKGYIRVQQSINGSTTPVAVKQLKIRSRWWFDYGTGYTNDNGYFECNETYRKNRKVNIICIFENSSVNIRAVKGTQFWDIFFTERKNIGDYQNSAMEAINYTFTNSSDVNSDTKRKWMCCHAINSVREQQIYCSQNGVMTPPSNLNMWLTNANTNGNSLSTYAAAPMLKQMSNSSLLVNATQLFLVATGHPWAAVTIQVLSQFPPDITYNYSQNTSFYTNSDRITQIFYHELAHASHYRKVGNSYWSSYIAYIVQHGGYGDSETNGSGRIAISEAWAEFCGARFAHLRYGNNNSAPNSTSWLEYIERFKPYPNPNNWSYWNWIPDGVIHDLTDNGEPTWLTNVTDNVSGYSISQCFGSMDADITSVTGYKTRFINEYGSSQQVNINELFKSYGY